MKIEPDSYFEESLGASISKGQSREVFAVKDDDGRVIKKEYGLLPYSNMVEWIVWGALQKMREDIIGNTANDELRQLFAECFAISESGRYLAMERLQPLTSTSQFRTSLYPDWLNDKKSRRSAYPRPTVE